MAICKNCGAEVGEEKVCPSCGTSVELSETVDKVSDFIEKAEDKVEDAAEEAKDKAEDLFEEVKDTAGDMVDDVKEVADDIRETVEAMPDDGECTPEDIQSNKWLSALSYLGLLVLVPFFAKKDSKYAQYHARQGFNLLAVDIIGAIVSGILGFIGTLILTGGAIAGKWYISVLSILFIGLATLIGIALLVFAVIGIVNALTGKAKELPLVGKLDVLRKIFKK